MSASNLLCSSFNTSTTLGSSVKGEICNLTPGDNNNNNSGGPDTATNKTRDNERQTSDASCKRPRSTESHACVRCPCVTCVPPWPRRARAIERACGRALASFASPGSNQDVCFIDRGETTEMRGTDGEAGVEG